MNKALAKGIRKEYLQLYLPSLPSDIEITPCPFCAGNNAYKASPSPEYWKAAGVFGKYLIDCIEHFLGDKVPFINNENYGELYCSENCRYFFKLDSIYLN